MNRMDDNRSYSGLVQKYIGTAYDTVAAVAAELDSIHLIEENINNGLFREIVSLSDAIVMAAAMTDYRGYWDPNTNYPVQATVTHGHDIWIASIANQNSLPALGNSAWTRLMSTRKDSLFDHGYTENTIAALMKNPTLIQGAEAGDVIRLDGYNESGDSGGGTFVYDPTLMSTNDYGVVIHGWVRQRDNEANLRWFGATGKYGDDATDAFEHFIAYLDTLKNGSHGTDHMIAGVDAVIPYGVYKIIRPIKFDNYLNLHLESNGAEIYYKGPALSGDNAAFTFNNCSWSHIDGLYVYCSFALTASYRVAMDHMKFQGNVLIKDVWNLKSDACWQFYGGTKIIAGHNHLYSGWSFEFGDHHVELMGSDGIVFQACYTEDRYTNFKMVVNDTYPDLGNITWRDCWFDVQKSSSVHKPTDSIMMFVNEASVPKVQKTTFLFDGCHWHSVALEPAVNKKGAFVYSDDVFMDIRVENSSLTISRQRRRMYEFAENLPHKSDRLFKGIGIFTSDIPTFHNDPLKDGSFNYPIISSTEMNAIDHNREKNKGWWHENFTSNGPGTVTKNGDGYVTLTNGSQMKIRVPVTRSYSYRDTEDVFIKGAEYFLGVTTKNAKALDIKIEAIHGSGSSSTVGASVIIAGYPTGIKGNPYYYDTEDIAFKVPMDGDLDSIQITIKQKAVTDAVIVSKVNCRQEGSDPKSWYTRSEQY